MGGQLRLTPWGVMRRILLNAMAALSGLGLAGAPLTFAQMHKVAKPEDVVRAVGVYEWLGDEAKPTASRLIPVTLFVDGELQDAGVYLARPIPLAIDSGTVYDIDKAGVTEGTLDVKYATHLQAADAAAYYDDGWFGYGTFSPPPKPKKAVALKESKAPAQIVSSKADTESDRPTFVRRQTSSTPAVPADNSDAKPDPKSDAKPDTSASPSTGSVPPDDPDRPHMSRRSPDSSASGSQPATADQSTTPAGDKTTTASTPGSAPGPAPANDPDRPTLKKRTPEEAKKARKESEQSGAMGLATSLNDDPNRPTLHRGRGVQALTENDLPKLKGVPVNLHQAVAVSDAKTRPTHDFSRPWADDAERASILAKMQALARAQLAAYKGAVPAAAPTAASGKTTTSSKTTAPSKNTASGPVTTATKRTPNSKLRRAKTTDTAAPEPLEEEQLNGYTLSYGGAATYVYTAHTSGGGAALRYVTVVAQIDAYGELKPAIQNVTDAAHLDRTPWMRLVDVVDADASNRASLLFEMRGQSARQFALYRVIAARPEQMFLSGTTQ